MVLQIFDYGYVLMSTGNAEMSLVAGSFEHDTNLITNVDEYILKRLWRILHPNDWYRESQICRCIQSGIFEVTELIRVKKETETSGIDF
jgi:hypothetical protein